MYTSFFTRIALRNAIKTNLSKTRQKKKNANSTLFDIIILRVLKTTNELFISGEPRTFNLFDFLRAFYRSKMLLHNSRTIPLSSLFCKNLLNVRIIEPTVICRSIFRLFRRIVFITIRFSRPRTFVPMDASSITVRCTFRRVDKSRLIDTVICYRLFR